MKKSLVSSALFACLLCLASTASAQKNLYDDKLYGTPGTGDYLRRVDNMVLNMSKKTGTMNDQERSTYRRAMHGNANAADEVTRSQRAKARRYDAAGKKYDQMYGKQWANSFNTFNTGHWEKKNGAWVWVK